MARRTRDRRIEPSFGDPNEDESEDDFAVGDDDRVLPVRARRDAPRAKPARTRAEPRMAYRDEDDDADDAPVRREARRPAQRREPAARERTRRASRRGGGGGGVGIGRLLTRAVYWMIVLGIWAGIAGGGLIAWYAMQMPSATTWSIPDRPPNVRILSVDGQLVANRGMMGGEAVGLHEMSPFIPQALIAIEDRRFRSHFGIDPIGLARALVENVTTGRVSQGGSTITQQLAKNLFLKPDRTIERKVQEVLLSLWLEQKYTKDQILEMYLNRVYFGSGSYGVEAASRRYFNKSARDVSLSEAALLAGLLKAPSRLSPARDPKAAESRAQTVLATMRDAGFIDDGALRTAMSAPATRAAAYWTGSEQYVADKVMEELPSLIGEIGADVIVETTVDLHLQKLAENSIRRLVSAEGKKLKVSQGALVSIDNTGAVRAMVGGYDYANSQFDRASEARRQPGSAFKPFVYMAALERGLTPDTIRRDAPIKVGKWQPANFKDKYYGDVTLSEALAKSLNSIAVKLALEAGPKNVIETAYRMGIESTLQNNASIALGTSEVTPLELTAAYVPFANGGFRPFVHFINKVTSPTGQVLWQRQTGGSPRVASAETIGMMNEMMSKTLADGTGRKAAFGWPAAGKTGTTQNSRDVWFVGFTANLTTGVWFGNDDGSPTASTGGSAPAQAWHEFMVAAHEGVPVAPLPGWSRKSPQQDFPAVPVAEGQPLAQGGGWSHDAVAAQIDNTASIDRPVPPGSVGQPATRRVNSILDVIMGN